jgi:hypothetical protein
MLIYFVYCTDILFPYADRPPRALTEWEGWCLAELPNDKIKLLGR